MKKQTLIALSVACIMVLIGIGHPSRTTAQVNISVGINLPPPPPLVVPAPPPMFVIPRTYVYFAPDVDVDIFFYGGYWYRPYRGYWYRSGAYNGKWVYLAPNKVPPVLLNLPPDFRRVPPGYRHIAYAKSKRTGSHGRRINTGRSMVEGNGMERSGSTMRETAKDTMRDIAKARENAIRIQ